MKVPSGLLHGLLCLMMTAGWSFFLTLSLPFLQEHMTTSPMEPDGSLLRRPLTAMAAMMNKFLAPELSAQFIIAATGRPRVILSLIPTAPVFDFLAIWLYQLLILYSIFFLYFTPTPSKNPLLFPLLPLDFPIIKKSSEKSSKRIKTPSNRLLAQPFRKLTPTLQREAKKLVKWGF